MRVPLAYVRCKRLQIAALALVLLLATLDLLGQPLDPGWVGRGTTEGAGLRVAVTPLVEGLGRPPGMGLALSEVPAPPVEVLEIWTGFGLRRESHALE